MKSASKVRSELDTIAAELDRLVLDPAAFTETTLRPPAAKLVSPRHIVVGVDGSAESRRAVEWSVVLAREYDAEVDLVSVVGQGSEFLIYRDPATRIEQSELAAAKDALTLANARLLRAGFDPGVLLLRGDPARELSRYAHKKHADLIVVGNRGRGRIARGLLGSVASKVKDIASCDVLIARGSPPPVRLLAAIDGSPESKQAVALASRLADDWAAEASVLLVVPPPSFGGLKDAKFAYRRRFDPLNLPHLKDPKIRFELEFGRPADVILGRARLRQCNLILLGSRGLGKIERLLMGSVSRRVANEAKASVWIVREFARKR